MLFLESFVVEFLILVVTALFFYYIYFLKVQAKFWSSREIPHVPPKFIIGNAPLLGITTSIGEFFLDYYKKYKEKRVIGYWSFHKPVLAVFDREIIKNILSRDFSYFHNRVNIKLSDNDELVAGNLFNLEDHAWRNMRVKLTPAFSSGKLKMMYPTMAQCGQELRDFLRKSAEEEICVDVKDVSARFTTNMIASCAFGIEANALKDPNSEFRIHGKKIFEPTVKQITLNVLAVILPYFGKLFKITQLPRDTNDFLINLVRDTMEFRKTNGVERKDFMQLLIELKEKGKIEDVDKNVHKEDMEDVAAAGNNDTKFSLTEAAAQAFVFFAAGFETSSITMTLALYELAKNKQIQDKLKEEIQTAMSNDGGVLTYDRINKLEYLECVIQETLRKYPVVPMLFRQSTKDYYMAEMQATIPKKTLVIMPIIGLARDPELFPEPEKFDPLRFSPERRDEIPSYCHIPFGEGPRICIGNRFALLQTKVGLTSILANYSVEPTERTPQSINFAAKNLTLSVKDGLYLKVVIDP